MPLLIPMLSLYILYRLLFHLVVELQKRVDFAGQLLRQLAQTSPIASSCQTTPGMVLSLI